MGQKHYMQVRIDPKSTEPLRALAKHNKRSVVGEANVAIEAHLNASRALLKQGPKLQPKKK